MTGRLVVLVDVDGDGAHPGARPGRHAAAATWSASAVRAAERAGFTAVTFADRPLPGAAPGRPDGVLRAAHAAPVTGSLGLVPVVPALYGEPFHLATQLASLDTISHGRAGWIADADPDPRLAARSGRAAVPDDAADEELVDVVTAIRRLWDSWEDDAVIRDVPTGRYLDRAKLHYADFVGRRFSVKGPAIIPRPPQGQPVTIAAAGTAADVDAVLLDAPADPGTPLAAAAAGPAADARRRHRDGVRVILSVQVVLEAAGVAAAARLAELDARAAWPADTVRHVGAAAGLAEQLAELAGVVDGVRLLPAALDPDLAELGRAVLPRLRAAGVHRPPRVGDTLRRSFGLERPANRFLEVTR